MNVDSITEVTYKFIYFEKRINLRKRTQRWLCKNNKSRETLGSIKWFPSWKQYCYFPYELGIYSYDCLEDIADFLKKLNGGTYNAR